MEEFPKSTGESEPWLYMYSSLLFLPWVPKLSAFLKDFDSRCLKLCRESNHRFNAFHWQTTAFFFLFLFSSSQWRTQDYFLIEEAHSIIIPKTCNKKYIYRSSSLQSKESGKNNITGIWGVLGNVVSSMQSEVPPHFPPTCLMTILLRKATQ